MKKSLKKIECVLTKPIRGKGTIGDIVSIRRGYARYLERFDKAIRLTPDVLKNIEIKKADWQKKEEGNLAEAQLKLSKLKKIDKITFYKRVSHADTLYSAIKQDEIIEYFSKKNIKLNKENVKIDRVIKSLGEHKIIINVYGDLEHSLTVEICKEG